MTARRLCACMRYCMIPAPSRRATMPTARRIATPTNRARTAHSIVESTSPVSKAGSTTCSVDQPSTQASATVRAANSRLPRVETAKTHGSRLTATQMTANPSRVVAARVGASASLTPTSTPDCHRPADHRANQPHWQAIPRDRSATLARRERQALCDTALALDACRPDAVRRLGRHHAPRPPDRPRAQAAALCGDHHPRPRRAHRAGDAPRRPPGASRRWSRRSASPR